MAQAVLKQPSHMTVEEFLAWDDGTDTRYELVGGEVFAMAPPSVAHADIIVNLAIDIGTKLRPPCRASAEVGIRSPSRGDTFYQADLAIGCSPRRPGDRYLGEPVVIIEVLSPGTANFDRGSKIPDYRAIPSVREIALVSSTEIKAETWHRTASGWEVMDVVGDKAVLRFASIDVEIPLGTACEGVVFETEKTG
ncbi:MAG: Uma2 family endonuclease [Magnetospirillum sp. WYHS-4]